MTSDTVHPAPLVTAQDLAAEIGDPRLRIYDCTTFLHPLPGGGAVRVESGRAGYEEKHVPGAAFLDLAAELSDTTSPFRFALLGPSQFAEAAGRLGIGDDTRVVLYDRTYGAWGARVWWMLKGYGFDNARVLDGGLTSWCRHGHPVEAGTRSYAPASLTVRPRAGYFVDKAEVMEAIGAPGARIVNALLPEQHIGTAGVHYGRPGRIPGSCNVSSRGIVDPQTQELLPPDELRRRFAEQGLLDGRRVIAYCGGGIAASLTALALTTLGANDVGVYMRSLQEWCADESCPLETGG